MRSVQEAVFAYGEWLDQQGLLVGETEDDKRSHDDLVNEFMAYWEA